MQLQHDAAREPGSQIWPQGELRGRRLAARRERSARSEQPVAEVERGDLPGLVEPGDVVQRGGFERAGAGPVGIRPRDIRRSEFRLRRLGKAAQQMRLAAPSGPPKEDEALAAL